MIAIRETPKGTSFRVKVQPRARKDAIAGTVGDAMKIALIAPPVEGKANLALIEFLAEVFEIPRSSITIASGETSRLKTVRITGVSKEAIEARLRGLIS